MPKIWNVVDMGNSPFPEVKIQTYTSGNPSTAGTADQRQKGTWRCTWDVKKVI